MAFLYAKGVPKYQRVVHSQFHGFRLALWGRMCRRINHGQDPLDQGSRRTVLLHDCDSQVTRSVPLSQVALDYSLVRVDDEELLRKRLACR
jgi:hypothetical protein